MGGKVNAVPGHNFRLILRLTLFTLFGVAFVAQTAASAQGPPPPPPPPPPGSAVSAAVTADNAAAAADDAPVKFEIADIHPSPPRRYSEFDGAFLVNGRYIMRQATLADLIETAYGLKDTTYVHGGPSWLEWDRWDVIAKVPPGTTQGSAKKMLQSLLKDRFGLVAHNGDGPMYVLTLAHGQASPALKPSSGTEEGTCKFDPATPGAQLPAGMSTPDRCHNVTMEQFAEILPTQANAYLQKPMVDRTGLKGTYDFELHWTGLGRLQSAGADGITVFDAVEKQLGLKITLGTAPGPVFLVDSMNKTPTPNSPDLAKIMPPMPPATFDVATIKPSTPDERQNARIDRNAVVVHNLPLMVLIAFAWDMNENDKQEIVGAPKWLATANFDVDAKVASESVVEGGNTVRGAPPISIEDLRDMIKQLLIDRFEMKIHTEDVPQDVYALVAANPKMTKADPAERTRCMQGPGPDGKDPRLDRPIMNMLYTCQNVTMEQAGQLFPTFAGYYLHYPAVDKTGLKGGWDFTLSWSSGDHMPVNAGPGAADSQGAAAGDPNGAVSFYDAVSKELGLKMVKEKRPEPVLVIDHMDDQPTPN
ncbi:MAG TPA: TIGR03435 family protein [Acidobacteriaceae bacterium]|nr:TIGR03435 family protein [Acidobacteriaceae bacterium]